MKHAVKIDGAYAMINGGGSNGYSFGIGYTYKLSKSVSLSAGFTQSHGWGNDGFITNSNEPYLFLTPSNPLDDYFFSEKELSSPGFANLSEFPVSTYNITSIRSLISYRVFSVSSMSVRVAGGLNFRRDSHLYVGLISLNTVDDEYFSNQSVYIPAPVDVIYYDIGLPFKLEIEYEISNRLSIGFYSLAEFSLSKSSDPLYLLGLNTSISF